MTIDKPLDLPIGQELLDALISTEREFLAERSSVPLAEVLQTLIDFQCKQFDNVARSLAQLEAYVKAVHDAAGLGDVEFPSVDTRYDNIQE